MNILAAAVQDSEGVIAKMEEELREKEERILELLRDQEKSIGEVEEEKVKRTMDTRQQLMAKERE